MTQMNGKIERSSIEDRALSPRRERPLPTPRQGELPAANLGEVARDVVDHAQVIARDALAIGKLSARRAVDRARTQARDVAPRIAFGAIAGVAGLVALVFLLIAVFIALGDPIPSVGWRMAIFGVFFLLLAVVAAIFAGSRAAHHAPEVRHPPFAGSEAPSSERTNALPSHTR
jgi:hypothetical protein